MRFWLSRLAMSLIVIACILMWELHRGMQNNTISGVRQGLYIAGAVLCFSLGAAGMKDRHRR